MLTLSLSTQYRKDYKRISRRGYNVDLLNDVIRQLLEQKTLAPRYEDHPLKGEFAGMRECHIKPNWLLIYEIDGVHLILTATRTGTHDDLGLE